MTPAPRRRGLLLAVAAFAIWDALKFVVATWF